METSELVRKAVDTAVNGKQDHSEGKVAKAIEQQTAKLPSDLFLWLGLGCLAASAITHATGFKNIATFIGQLSSPILIMGLYNKVVKLEGSDKFTKYQF
ncbi:MAG: hypothetical protein JWO32_531 [Bacteroidetes bacterium]|nr:hypothetical protein [Bacteroidota bacterium]